VAAWFETRGIAALLTMRVQGPHPEERVSKDESPCPFSGMTQIEGNTSFVFPVRFAMIRFKSPDEAAMALQLRPNCEYCDKDLPPDATDARICSYECTFCADCVDTKLHNVCPNCGGGFVPRPIRPATERRPGVCVTKQLPSDKRVHLKYSLEDVAAHSARLRDIPPQER
jgi:hypothetical protein